MIVVSNKSPLSSPQGGHPMVTSTTSSSSNRYGDENQLNIDDALEKSRLYYFAHCRYQLMSVTIRSSS